MWKKYQIMILVISLCLIIVNPACKKAGDDDDHDTPATPIYVKLGFGDAAESEVLPDNSGIYLVSVKLQNLLQIILTKSAVTSCTGLRLIGTQYAPLPAGSTLNALTATFTWVPLQGFLGDFTLEFRVTPQSGSALTIKVKITVTT